MALNPRMADSVSPWLIPSLYASRPNGVAVYRDGPHAWTLEQQHRFPWQWGITVTADPAMAPHCRVLDVEHEDVTPSHVEPYQDLRAMIHGEETTVYCSRDTVPLVMDADTKWDDLLWWIATLDNHPWTPQEIHDWLLAHFGRSPQPSQIRAIQWQALGTFDGSTIFGDPEWLHVAA